MGAHYNLHCVVVIGVVVVVYCVFVCMYACIYIYIYIYICMYVCVCVCVCVCLWCVHVHAWEKEISYERGKIKAVNRKNDSSAY